MFQHNRVSFQSQLNEDHKISGVKKYLQEVVYGGTDGIISTFVVVSGFSGASSSNGINTSLPLAALLLFGFANLIADAVSMALGNFLSIKADKEVYEDLAKKEMTRLHLEKSEEMAETEYLLVNKGFTRAQARKMARIMSQNRPYWLSFMMGSELHLDNILDEKPFITALVTFFSFILFGFIPLMPFLLLKNYGNNFIVSMAATAFALILMGAIRSHLTKKAYVKTILEVLLVGTMASGVAFLVGTFF